MASSRAFDDIEFTDLAASCLVGGLFRCVRITQLLNPSVARPASLGALPAAKMFKQAGEKETTEVLANELLPYVARRNERE